MSKTEIAYTHCVDLNSHNSNKIRITPTLVSSIRILNQPSRTVSLNMPAAKLEQQAVTINFAERSNIVDKSS